MELPPRARRILWCGLTADARLGTTSAYAENTFGYKRPCKKWWNYLRIRGEYPKSPANGPRLLELPPHTRRILFEGQFNAGFSGTTSAYAENTAAQRPKALISGNYLRIRGEYRGHKWHISNARELPPHTRRIPVSFATLGHFFGTTSAYAENTDSLPHKILSIWNYLRIRGEYIS